MAEIVFDGVSLTYPGARTPSVKHLDLTVEDGEFLVLVGPSGCGKSTTLRMLAGLEPVTEGTLYIGGRDVTNLPPKDRDVSMVFQNYALYPHMTVAQNMGFALRIAKVGKEEITRRVAEAARVLGLTEYLERKPKALSGGQRQRVAMGRAIVREPQVFLMDEPLSNLDAKLRVQTRAEIASLQRRLATTTVYVTHDQVEAMTMGDRVAVLDDGVLQQRDTPRQMYDRPVNSFVAGFIGSPAMNLLRLPFDDEGVHFGGTCIPVSRETRAAAGNHQVVLGVRPEHLDFHARHSTQGLPVTFYTVEELGSDGYAYGHLDQGGGEGEPFIVRTYGHEAGLRDATVRVVPRHDEIHLFDAETGRRLPD